VNLAQERLKPNNTTEDLYFVGFHVVLPLVFCQLLSRSLFVFLSFFCWPLIVLLALRFTASDHPFVIKSNVFISNQMCLFPYISINKRFYHLPIQPHSCISFLFHPVFSKFTYFANGYCRYIISMHHYYGQF